MTDGIAFTANHGKVPYDATRDFDSVTIPATTMQVLAIHPSIEARSIQGLVAHIKANPGKYSYASDLPCHTPTSEQRIRSALRL
jgi:tripartite-type tricarboxylate transporter receptor subunit TctC